MISRKVRLEQEALLETSPLPPGHFAENTEDNNLQQAAERGRQSGLRASCSYSY